MFNTVDRRGMDEFIDIYGYNGKDKVILICG